MRQIINCYLNKILFNVKIKAIITYIPVFVIWQILKIKFTIHLMGSKGIAVIVS